MPTAVVLVVYCFQNPKFIKDRDIEKYQPGIDVQGEVLPTP